MTPRERLLTAIAVKEPDRVPISCCELAGYDPKSWYNKWDSYKSLTDLVREKTDCMYMASLPVAPLVTAADVTLGVELQYCSFKGPIDVRKWREGKSLFAETIYHTPKGDLKALYRVNDDTFTVWKLEHLLKDIGDIDKYISLDLEQPMEFDLSELTRTQAELGENGIMMFSLSDPICEVAELFDMSQFLIFSMTDTDRIKHFMDFVHERQIAYLKAVLQAGLDAGVDWSECLFRICGPEYATPPYLSPEYFAAFVTPYVKRMTEILHQYDTKVRLHSHGKIGKVLDEIMKTEPDALDPIEPPPDGDIELGEVKKRIGDEVCLFGNIELKLLEHGQAEEVRDFVIDTLTQAKAGGGFVCMPTAAPINDPLSEKTEENYRVFIETALEYGRY